MGRGPINTWLEPDLSKLDQGKIVLSQLFVTNDNPATLPDAVEEPIYLAVFAENVEV